MYLECRGSGSPTVVLVSGLDAAADVWTGYQAHSSRVVFNAVAGFARVCAYDRPGTPVGDDLAPSRSDPVPQPTMAHDAVRDLHALLRAAGEPGPYLLVGHSYSGLITRRYAGEYPGEVAGIVFVDAFATQWQTAVVATLDIRSQNWHVDRSPFTRLLAMWLCLLTRSSVLIKPCNGYLGHPFAK
jgi:pimeloyl-ACP methyl ester carboxylesterase